MTDQLNTNQNLPNHIDKGRQGENLAKNYLLSIGYSWLESNFRTEAGEIDLLMKDGDVLVIVEVKRRKFNENFEIKQSINQRKINRILKTTEIYIERKQVYFSEMRVDAVFIIEYFKSLKVKHYKDYASFG